MKKYIFILLALVISGCVTTKTVMESWMEHEVSELVSSWGAPHSALNTRDGKRVLTWESHWGKYGRKTCRKSFTVNRYGKIISWSYRDCPPWQVI